MKISDFDYSLPECLIAQKPKKSREKSRFLIYDSKTDQISHQHFVDLIKHINHGDLIVVNNTKVFPVRLIGQKESGGKIEVLLLNQVGNNWKCLIGGKVKKGQEIVFDSHSERSEEFLSLSENSHSLLKSERPRSRRREILRHFIPQDDTKTIAKIISKNQKEAIIKFNNSGKKLLNIIEEIGKTPIPPYIIKKIKNQKSKIKINENYFRRQYQTVYAKNGFSSAAPTAGLHFSEAQVSGLKKQGIKFAEICLNVGLGTFAPIDQDNIKKGKLHFENFTVPYSTIKKIKETKKSGGKVIAVGTTTVRTLESIGTRLPKIKKFYSGKTDLFIRPGFQFKIVDELITNFHLPKSSLMMLVAAFIEHKTLKSNYGRKKLLELYETAVEEKYRFYSFGDAMMVK